MRAHPGIEKTRYVRPVHHRPEQVTEARHREGSLPPSYEPSKMNGGMTYVT